MDINKELSTKMQIVESAINLYKKQGYTNITVQDICNEVGITRGAFYYHFKSKDDILMTFICILTHMPWIKSLMCFLQPTILISFTHCLIYI